MSGSGMIYQAGEDFNFLQGAQPGFTNSYTGSFRGSMGVRGVVQPAVYGSSLNPAKSDQFSAALTAGWFSWQEACPAQNSWYPADLPTQPPNIGGLGQFSSTKGLFLSATNGSPQQLALYKYDGTTYSLLAAEVGGSLSITTLQRFDVQFSYSATGFVKVYVNGALVLVFNGDTTISGVSGFDCYINGPSTANNEFGQGFSEVMVATDDTRPRLALVTQVSNAQGTTNAWENNAYGNTNELVYSDLNPTYDNNNGDNQQYGLTPTPSGTYDVDAIAIAVRGAVGSGSSVSKMGLGYNQGGTVYFGSGAAKSPAAYYSMLYQLDLVNPNGSTAWTQAVANSQQVNLQAQT